MTPKTKTETLLIGRLRTPLGDMLGAIDEAGSLVRLDFCEGKRRPRDESELSSVLERQGFETRASNTAFTRTRSALEDYFQGHGEALACLPVNPQGTDFQCSIWSALQDIPWGQTRTYGDLAKNIGRPGAARAAGAANGANTLAIIVPCHRVIGANGRLTGYAGGLERKRRLLALEGVQL